MAPAASCRRAISGVFGVLKCGLSFCGRAAKYAAIVRIFSSTTSRSRINAGVSISRFVIARTLARRLRNLLLQQFLRPRRPPFHQPLAELRVTERDNLRREQ